MRLLALLSIAMALIGAGSAAADPAPARDLIPAAVISDPAPDPAHPASLTAVAIPTHGVRVNGVLYAAAGPGPHPTVLLLHGLPGNEQNGDLAQSIRRDGWSVVTLHYRGSWGSGGAFSFTHCLEDAAAAVDWLRSPDGGGALGVDRNRIVVIGHSMGGWIAALTFEHDPTLLGAGLISAADLGALGKAPRAAVVAAVDQNIGATLGLRPPLAGASPESLGDDLVRNAAAWDFASGAGAIGKRPLFVATSDDGFRGPADALATAVQAQDGAEVVNVHFATDHSYSDHRIALQAAVLRWLENLSGAPAGM